MNYVTCLGLSVEDLPNFFVFSKIVYQWVKTDHCFMSDMPEV